MSRAGESSVEPQAGRGHPTQGRQLGKITDWKDEKGFGFITPIDGSETIFVHATAFAVGSRRPAGNEVVSYALTTDERGRTRAADVLFVAGNSSRLRVRPAGWQTLTFIGSFIAVLLGAIFLGRIPVFVLALYGSMSLITYAVYAFDKSSAAKSEWRTQESTLHLLALVGGWPGALLAQRRLRHKSKKELRSWQISLYLQSTRRSLLPA
jgi:uncharacterized membrane protein YsdA (DUF1294 family)/cold shock CspA family protein